MERTEHERNKGQETGKAAQRDDAEIERDIMKAFDDLGIGKTSRPAVIVEDGAVILSGEVRSSEDIEICQKAVSGVAGVRKVDNSLRVVH